MENIRPGMLCEVFGRQYKVMATNFEGKIILAPADHRESTVDMMTRLQSTVPTEQESEPKP